MLYNYIGGIYDEQGNYPEALKNLFAALTIFEEIGDKLYTAKYLLQNRELSMAIKKITMMLRIYLNQGLSLSKEIGSLLMIEKKLQWPGRIGQCTRQL